jgi:mannose-6-phosphate isomerase-like protein (cupin superfamily)
MDIRTLSDDKLEAAYGIRYQAVYPARDNDSVPVGFGWAVVEPGGATEPHEHPEHECFLIISGSGVVRVGTETSSVSSRQAVLLPADVSHEIRNDSADRLVLLSVYWNGELGGVDL